MPEPTVTVTTIGQEPTNPTSTNVPAPAVDTSANPNQNNNQEADSVEKLPKWAQTLLNETRKEAANYRNQAKSQADKAQVEEQERLKKQGEWQTLAEQQTERAKALEAELLKVQRNAMLAQVASRHKLPPELASRLQGQTEQELETDAAALAKLVLLREAQTAPGAATRTPAPATSTQIAQADIEKAKQELLRSGRYGM